VVELAVVMFIILVFVVGLVGGLGWVAKWLDRPRPPLELLRETFAKGQIDEAEYLRRLSVLELDSLAELDEGD
jgi:uncharacterized membrane protein